MHMEFVENQVLAPYTSFQIGGPARWFAQATTEDDLLAGVTFARRRQLPLFVLGGGSNLLVSDNGFPGLVMRICLRGVSLEQQSGSGTFSVAAGEDWDTFVARTVEEGYSGLECLSGIPGTVGATPVQNVGAYGQEVSQSIAGVRAFDLRTLEFVTLTNSECGFSYRRSVFNTLARERYIVTRVAYTLTAKGEPTLTYKDLKLYFKDRTPALLEVRTAVRSIRARKGMLIVPGDPDSLSAGSFFKNPIVPLAAIDQIAEKLKTEADRIPHYPASDGMVKLPAAWLLEQAGFSKGYALGRAAISSRHTLALINRGHAKAADVIALANRIKDQVSDRFGIHLEPEPVLLG